MGQTKKKVSKGRTEQRKLPSLKKLPAKKSKTDKNYANQIVLDIQPRKNFSSIIEIIKRNLPGGLNAKMPLNIKPMLATLLAEPFTDTDWQFEPLISGQGTTILSTKNLNPFMMN